METQSIQLRLSMITFLILCFSFFLNPQIIKVSTTKPPYTPTEHILLDCGSQSKLTATDGQSWDGDVGTKFSPDINNVDISFPATATEQDPSISSPVPYMTARIFRSQFSYSFPVSPGQKFLRLYFYPATYSGASDLLRNQAFFSVQGNQYSLLRNFSASLAVLAAADSQLFKKSASLVKEFIINVGQTQLLNITFSPSANSYAFINGIEVVSIPDDLYMGTHDLNNNPLEVVNRQNYLYDFDQNKTVFETLYRVNVGGQAISSVDDTGMFRQWFQDSPFGAYSGNSLSNDSLFPEYTSQTPNYTAPPNFYTTARAMGRGAVKYNLTWTFQVDSGFYYLLRLHFCEFMPYFANFPKQRVFRIYINNMTAEREANVIRWAGSYGIPVFKDYVVLVPNSSYNIQRKQVLFLALSPAFVDYSLYLDAILSGLEIFKLNSTSGNLAGSNPVLSDSLVPSTAQQPEHKKGHMVIMIAVVGGVFVGGVVILALYFLLNYRRRQGMKDFDRNGKSSSKSPWPWLSRGTSALPSEFCRRFLLEEIILATHNFDAAFMIGTGGFGNVYKGYIDNKQTTVAIKRLNPSSRQGVHEFRTEIEMLSNLRHLHLVSLIGYCDEKGEMILVYD